MSSTELVDIGGYRLRLGCAGHGEPTVVIDAAAGNGLREWVNVLAVVSTFTRICAYDRAGVGKSDRGPKPRTSSQKVAELQALLVKAQIKGPYVLVGHSLGGLHMQLFAASYPEEVAGMVLVDPSLPDLRVRLRSALGRTRTALLWGLQAATAGERMTRHDWNASFAEAAAAGQLPDVPLVVVSAGQPPHLPPPLSFLFSPAAIMRAMQVGHAAIVESSAQGRHIIDAKSNHTTIQRHQAVIDAIQLVVEAAR